MLEKRLASEKQKNVGRAKSLLAALCVVGFGALLIVQLPAWDRTSVLEKVSASDKKSPASQVVPIPNQTGQAIDHLTAGANRATSSEPVEGKSRGSECTTGKQIDEQCKKYRNDFKTGLKEFESDLEPQLEYASVRKWSPKNYEKIFLHKQMALQAFGEGRYLGALEEIGIATKEALEILEVKKEKFSNHLKAAIKAFDSNQFEMATIEIGSALALAPDHSIAKEYRSRIDMMPEINSYLNKAFKARVENDFRSEMLFLKDVVRLDSAREKEKERLGFLKREIAEWDFANLMSKGLEALDRRDIVGAKTSIKKARMIFPDRLELFALIQRADRLDRELSVNNALKVANHAISKDDWDRALQEFSKAQSIDPENIAATRGKKIASEVLAGRIDLDRFLDKPDRLASREVSVAARRLLKQVKHLIALSPALRVQSEKLSTLISQSNTSIEVTVKSDGITEISVRRVGIVGKTIEKVISLRPGDYMFEGRRAGFKSKLIKVSIPFNSPGVEIKIVCDEKL